MVYVISRDGNPLMPTERYGKVRRLLRDGKAKVIMRCPFTIQLLYDSGSTTQPIVLGVDAGSKHVGLSACTEKKELYAAEMTPRNDVVSNISDRRQLRSARRYRKTRYRKKRFSNRIHGKRNGWVAPSIKTKIQEHVTAVSHVLKILPIAKIVIETAEFDLQRLKAMEQGNPLPVGVDYQLGEMYDYYNVRQYVLRRDNYTCQCCRKRPTEKDRVKLHVHHKESRRTGGNAPNNLVTLCEDCHKAIHAGKISFTQNKRCIRSTRDAVFMGIMRKALLAWIKSETNIPVFETHGYITKYMREKYLIPKTHVNDARCIAGYPQAVKSDEQFLIRAMRCHNRKIHKAKVYKHGTRVRSQATHTLFGFRLWDKVRYNGIDCFIRGRRSDGYFVVSKLDGTTVSACASYKKLKFLETANHYLTERHNVEVKENNENG